ncbi:hypothetical protein BOX15_Mlig027284g3 [Macrostomum lignano]|uniref:Uncharacterized protein n=2 Tax=Macrostomum lignano TaxID=282301 RepID=A0A267E4U9_9PLAT|nr:hypothetical protein BOX15_Mlig027284g3 [Macrostomum lignano]
MGNCIQKQRERELAKRALRRDELVKFFLDRDFEVRDAQQGSRQTGGSKIREQVPKQIDKDGKAVDQVGGSPARVVNSSSRDSPAGGPEFGDAVLAVATAAAAVTSAGAPAGSWRLTDRQREATLYAMENDGIERLHENDEMQLEQRRERARREERLEGIGVSGGGGGGGGAISGAPSNAAISSSFHGTPSTPAFSRHVSFAVIGHRRGLV